VDGFADHVAQPGASKAVSEQVASHHFILSVELFQ
jgi:hypothetical protein